MFARFGHATFGNMRWNENRTDSDNDQQLSFIPQDRSTAALVSGTPAVVTYQAQDAPQDVPYTETPG